MDFYCGFEKLEKSDEENVVIYKYYYNKDDGHYSYFDNIFLIFDEGIKIVKEKFPNYIKQITDYEKQVKELLSDRSKGENIQTLMGMKYSFELLLDELINPPKMEEVNDEYYMYNGRRRLIIGYYASEIFDYMHDENKPLYFRLCADGKMLDYMLIIKKEAKYFYHEILSEYPMKELDDCCWGSPYLADATYHTVTKQDFMHYNWFQVQQKILYEIENIFEKITIYDYYKHKDNLKDIILTD